MDLGVCRMICEDTFLELPSCKLCRNKGKYNVRCNTVEQQDDYGVAPGEMVTVKCSTCRKNLRRREEFLKNTQFEDPIRYYELSDYELPDESQKFNHKASSDALKLAQKMIDNIEYEIVDKAGFIYITGGMNTGKTIISHIIARESYLQGVMVNRISIPELAVTLSHKIQGTIVRDGDEIVFDLDDYLDVDLLIVDQFELINSYFGYPTVRRSLIYNIFAGRLKLGKPTIVISKEKLVDMFSEEKMKAVGFPHDFPSIINKCYRTMNLNGRFKEQKAKAGNK